MSEVGGDLQEVCGAMRVGRLEAAPGGREDGHRAAER
jgi:hypothetical protein